MSAQDEFAAKVEESIREARAFGPAVRARVMELLEEARKRIVGAISAVDSASAQASQLRTMAQEIDRALEQFGRELSDSVRAAQEEAFRAGEATVDAPLAAAGFATPSFTGLSRTTLAIAQGYTADLISGLTTDASAKLNAAIQRAFLGGQSIGDIIEQVGRAISSGEEGEKFSGLFSPIGARAETIALNEILRVHSIATQARLEEAQQASGGAVKKQWKHVPIAIRPRIAHVLASGQIRDVDQPFDIGGAELMYPRDPNGEPEDTINCHCVLVPYVDAADLEPTAKQRQLLKDAGIGITVSPG